MSQNQPPRTRAEMSSGLSPTHSRATRHGTKQAKIINLLARKRGTSIDDLVNATGWQPHSVRSAISGTLKKKLGLNVTSECIEARGRVYRLSKHG